LVNPYFSPALALHRGFDRIVNLQLQSDKPWTLSEGYFYEKVNFNRMFTFDGFAKFRGHSI
jgi:hypothetical protein